MTARYAESKERSAELLRAALRLMGQHAACCNPVSFAVWYEHAAGSNLRLSRAIDACLRERPVLDDADLLQLHRDHIVDPGQEAVQEINTELQRVMSGVAANMSSSGASAGRFGEQVDRLAQALAQGESQALPALLDGAAAGAQEMQATTTALLQRIHDGQAEIERLRADLTRVRDETLHDAMTGVLNRKGFDLRIAALTSQPAEGGQTHSLVMFDIDHFKQVNDRHGHVLGDQVIRGVAELLRRCMPGGEHSVARYGGEEFAVLLPSTSVAEGAQLADAVRQRVAEMKIRDRRTQQVLARVTISAGVAAMQAGDEPAHWVARADRALYRSKQAGRDRVSC